MSFLTTVADRENVTTMQSKINEQAYRVRLSLGGWRSSFSPGRRSGFATITRLVVVALTLATFPFLDAAEPCYRTQEAEPYFLFVDMPGEDARAAFRTRLEEFQ